MLHPHAPSLDGKQTGNADAGKLNVVVVSSLFSMRVLTHVPPTGVQAQNGKPWIWFGCVYLWL